MRSAKLATLPIGVAGRVTLGVGKRLGGKPAEVVAAEVQQRTAEQMFKVLGQLKGGAMKFGQALSVFEAALPEEVSGPYRQVLTKLQESAPALPAASVHKVLARDFGANWRDRFTSFEDKPSAAASIGQVHKAIWSDGREVAVKVQYPGAGQALMNDLTTLSRMARLFSAVSPGLDIKPLLAELRERVAEELDYGLEASSQRVASAAFKDDPDVLIPDVVDHGPHTLITEWVEGTPLSAIIADGTQEQRDRAGLVLSRFLYSGPARSGLLHADPHPGNFRLREDGRLVVLDFGAVARLPEGMPEPIGRLARLALARKAEATMEGLRREGFVKAELDIEPAALLDYLVPLLDPIAEDSFTFSREWLRAQATRIGDPRSPAAVLGRQLNLPPAYLLIHRVTLGSLGILCQLGSTVALRAEVEQWQPGFAEPGSPAAEHAFAANRAGRPLPD